MEMMGWEIGVIRVNYGGGTGNGGGEVGEMRKG